MPDQTKSSEPSHAQLEAIWSRTWKDRGAALDKPRDHRHSLVTGTGHHKYDAIKYGQEYPHDTEKWVAYFGLRSTVKCQNAYIKNLSTEDIEDPKKRRFALPKCRAICCLNTHSRTLTGG
ncbi:MAG: hypothetical protein JWQ59_769 [Cryobacterium sp.]|nr:hypothetical protein [Cryobacterium sp.]